MIVESIDGNRVVMKAENKEEWERLKGWIEEGTGLPWAVIEKAKGGRDESRRLL